MQPLVRLSGNTWIDYERLAKALVGQNPFLIYESETVYQ
jgi:hypothetical protein